MIVTILIFLLLLSILVLAHECGHYFVAKRAGIKVEEFGIGFPPRIFSWINKSGMRWSLNAIPLGGFVKIKGESGENRNDADSFARKSVWVRIAVLVSGVIMNLILAAVLLSFGFAVGMPAVVEGGVSPSARVSDRQIVVTEVLEGSPAQVAGIEVGDAIISVNAISYQSSAELRRYFGNAPVTEPLSIQFDRKGEIITTTLETKYLDEIQKNGAGLGLIDIGIVSYPWYLSPGKGIEATAYYSINIVIALWDLIRGAFSGQPILEAVASPIGIAVMTGEMAKQGFVYLLQFAAFLSINLAIINVLPLPALDGGRIAFVLLEIVRRRKSSPKLEAIVHNIGFALLMILAVVVIYNDLVKYL